MANVDRETNKFNKAWNIKKIKRTIHNVKGNIKMYKKFKIKMKKIYKLLLYR